MQEIPKVAIIGGGASGIFCAILLAKYNIKDIDKNEELYKDKIGPSGFKKIWQGITWSNIMPEVYTPENKAFHAKNTGQKGSTNGRALLTEKDVYEIR